jgi:tetratricopeptide (TPR) repeat protein
MEFKASVKTGKSILCRYSSLGILAFLTIGCASAQLTIESEPLGADIYLNVGKQVPSKLGQTPYTMNTGVLGLNTESFMVTVSKEGFDRQSVLVPVTALSNSSVIAVRLNQLIVKDDPKLKAAENLDMALEQVARGVANIQSLIQSKEYDQAQSTTTALLATYPNLSILYDLLGNIYYLRKDVERSLANYKKAQLITPNPETLRMINKLQELRAPASNSQFNGGAN